MPQVRARVLSVAIPLAALGLLTPSIATGVSSRPALAAKYPPSSHGFVQALAAVPHSHDLWAIDSTGSKTFVAKRHHGKWSKVAVTGGVGSSIAAGSAKRVWVEAGGGVDQLRGGRFVPVKVGGQSVFGVRSIAASSASNAWTIGELGDTGGYTALHWNGSTWVKVALPPADDGSWGQIATSGPRNVWVVYLGDADAGGTILHWNGSSWKSTGVISTQVTIYAIASTAPTRALLVGVRTANGAHTYSARFNGSKWVSIKTPNPGGEATLRGLAMSGNKAWAVGLIATNISDKPLVMMTSGHGWKIQHLPKTGSDSFLNAASAASSKLIYAGGERATGPYSDSPYYSLAAQSNGKTWTLIPSKVG